MPEHQLDDHMEPGDDKKEMEDGKILPDDNQKPDQGVKPNHPDVDQGDSENNVNMMAPHDTEKQSEDDSVVPGEA